MGYELKWGNKTGLYAGGFGLVFGLAILMLFKNMIGEEWFWNYYSPMLGYYVLISICQSHYFKREPKPDMGGLFRQFVSIFGAVVLFYFNQLIILGFFQVPVTAHPVLHEGGIVMAGHFTFIVFGFFIYGFDDFMFKGKLLGWMKNDKLKAFSWYLLIWLIWALLFYWGVAKAYSAKEFDGAALDRLLAISQWIIIMSLLYALVFRDWLPELQEKLKMKNDYVFGIFLLLAAAAIGAAIAYLLYFIVPFLAPWATPDPFTSGDRWHRVLYLGTYPLTPAVLLGVYTKNFSGTKTAGMRVLKRIGVLIPAIIALYYVFHFIIADPRIILELFLDDVPHHIGLFQHHTAWYHQPDLYFNFTVSIIPLTHHWFCGKWGFVKKVKDKK